MRLPRRRRLAIPALAAVLLAMVAATAHAEGGGVTADEATLRDFLIQNVCLDARGTVLAGVSPADRNPECVAQRDLRPGELLPYHKHDHPSPDQREGAPRGYQRHDSFPVDTAGLGVVVEHSFDFGDAGGRRFGVFDIGTDGGDIAVLSPGHVSIAATEDGGLGFQLFVGECEGAVTPAALSHSWIVVEFDPDRPASLRGETVARLNDLTVGHQEACPTRFNAAYTSWHVAPFRFRAAPGQGAPITLTTLISDHYGGERRDSADHLERFYYTRELGSIRWERWQNLRGNRQYNTDRIAEAARWFAGTGRCSDAPMPEGGATMVLIDCREWTRIVPPDDPGGDRPGFFIEAIRSRRGIPDFFRAPAAPK